MYILTKFNKKRLWKWRYSRCRIRSVKKLIKVFQNWKSKCITKKMWLYLLWIKLDTFFNYFLEHSGILFEKQATLCSFVAGWTFKVQVHLACKINISHHSSSTIYNICSFIPFMVFISYAFPPLKSIPKSAK